MSIIYQDLVTVLNKRKQFYTLYRFGTINYFIVKNYECNFAVSPFMKQGKTKQGKHCQKEDKARYNQINQERHEARLFFVCFIDKLQSQTGMIHGIFKDKY